MKYLSEFIIRFGWVSTTKIGGLKTDNPKTLSARSVNEHGRGGSTGAGPSRFLEDRTRYLFIVFLISFIINTTGWIWEDAVSVKDKKARNLYNEGRTEEALEEWRGAQTKDPDNKELHYNIGVGLYGQGKYEEAFNEYRKSLDAENDQLRASAYYNIGNTNYRMGRLEDAIKSYEKTLEINPEDEDAKFNIEFIKKKLEEVKKKQKEGREKDKKEEQEEQDSQKKDKGQDEKESAEKQTSGKEESKDSSGKREDKGEKGKQGDKKEKPEGLSGEKENKGQDMSEQDAIRLLDALKDDEKEIHKALQRHYGEGKYKVDKDW